MLLAVRTSNASNGMNMIGYGAESITMGGADLAITSSPSAMNINPSGIGRCTRPEVSLGVGLMRPSLSHEDALGNNREDVLDRYPMPFLGYVQPVRDFTFGVGLFVQGGMGAEYPDLTTPFAAMANSGQLPPGFFEGDLVPDTDVTLTRVTHAKLTPTVAWRVHPELTLGASLNLSYAMAEMKLFPGTSVNADLDRSGAVGDSPEDFFFGMHVEDMSSLNYGLRAGFQYTAGALSIGGAYSTETPLDYDGGTTTLNLSALGLGNVTYDAEMSGFAWPQQVGLGLAYRINPRLLIAGDVDWVGWSGAIETVTIEIENPDEPMAPPSREIQLRMGWEDQWVWAVGVELTPARDYALRLGYNHGDSPITDSKLRPLFPAIAEDHITGGFGVTKGPWIFDLGLEYVLQTQKTNNSLDRTVNLFGPGSQETLSQLVAHFMVRLVLSS
jgi:long-chain fatty acid transport protein